MKNPDLLETKCRYIGKRRTFSDPEILSTEIGNPEISETKIVSPFTRGNVLAKDPYFFSLPYVYFLGALLAKIFTLALLSSQPVRPYILRFPPLQYFRRDNKISLLSPPQKKKLKLAKLQKTTHNTTNNTTTPFPQRMARRHDWLFLRREIVITIRKLA